MLTLFRGETNSDPQFDWQIQSLLSYQGVVTPTRNFATALAASKNSLALAER
jgi:hypothetical protein